jgi:hypothetical protein
MYKFQLIYVYINDYQSGGEMWYDLFNKSLIALLFGSLTLLGYLGLQLKYTYLAGPFYFFMPLPFGILYFLYYCKLKFFKQSKSLSFGFAKELDQHAKERKKAGISTPHDSFSATLYRQPALTEPDVYPEPYRAHMLFHYQDLESVAPIGGNSGISGGGGLGHGGATNSHRHRGSLSIDMEEVTHDSDLEADDHVLKRYFDEYVVPLANESYHMFEVSLSWSLLDRIMRLN